MKGFEFEKYEKLQGIDRRNYIKGLDDVECTTLNIFNAEGACVFDGLWVDMLGYHKVNGLYIRLYNDGARYFKY